ncbi:hypothetical protein K474DRAFT_1714316 [Panus rudis PR-1116 ss-1]|nr:hypothetical protein K474DRAFT_1714316 [Panus rudis PR-1116 ss-1]
MLVNLLRLLGAVKISEASRQAITCPTQVDLLLSPFHGLFGKDGLYSESKISLRLSSTGGARELGRILLSCRCCHWLDSGKRSDRSQQHDRSRSRKPRCPHLILEGDGVQHTQSIPPFKSAQIGTIYNTEEEKKESEFRCAITRDNAADLKVTNGVAPRAKFCFNFVLGIAGISARPVESSRSHRPWTTPLSSPASPRSVLGIARALDGRWEAEARGEITVEGRIEMAWLMGGTMNTFLTPETSPPIYLPSVVAPNGAMVITGGIDGEVTIWDCDYRPGARVQTLQTRCVRLQ